MAKNLLSNYLKAAGNVASFLTNPVGTVANKLGNASAKPVVNTANKAYQMAKGATSVVGGVGANAANTRGGGFRGSDSSSSSDYNSSYDNSGSYGGSYSGGGGGVAVPAVEDYRIDLSDILKSYTESAEAQKQTIKDTTAATIKAMQDSEASQRATLTKALERFQQDTAEQRKQQQQAFNSNRADLEAQAYLANRQALQSAAARGLGGSGLQQLAQLQNLINQSNATNELASGNTETLNTIAQALARQEEDTRTSLNDLATNLATKMEALNTAQANQLNEIDKNAAGLKAQLQYQEETRAQDARRQAEQFAASLAAQNASSAANWSNYAAQEEAANQEVFNQIQRSYNQIIGDAEDKIASINKGKGSKTTKNKAIEDAYNTAKSQVRALTAQTGMPGINSDDSMNRLNYIYSSAYNKNTNKNLTTTLSDLLRKAMS